MRATPSVLSFQMPHATAACQATRTVATIVAAQRGTRRAWLNTPAEMNVEPTIAPKTPHAAAHAAREPSTSVAISWPSTAPVSPTANTAARRR